MQNRQRIAEVVFRVLGGLVATAALGYLAFFLLVIGTIEATGCFLECTHPNLWAGIPLLTAAVAAAAGAVSTLVWALTGAHRRTIGRVYVATLGIGVLVVAVGSLT